MSNTQFKFKIGSIVHYTENPEIQGVIVDIGYLGQIENITQDFDLSRTYEQDIDNTFVDNENEYYQPWYRIMWCTDDRLSQPFTTPTRQFNGQECEDSLTLII